MKNTIPRQITVDDQYSVPRQSVITDSIPPSDEWYAAPRQSIMKDTIPRQITVDDQYSVPRQSVINDSIPPSDEWYAAPRQSIMKDTIPRQISVDDQCTVSRESIINNSIIPHQSSGDNQYSVPHQSVLIDSIPRQSSVNDQYSAPRPSVINDNIAAPDPRRSMKNNSTVPDQLTTEDEYAVPHKKSQKNTSAQVINDEEYAIPSPRVNKDHATTKEDECHVPNPKNVAKDSSSSDNGYGSLYVTPGSKNTSAVHHEITNDEEYAVPCPRVNKDHGSSKTTTEDEYSVPNPSDNGYGSLYVVPRDNSDYVNLKNKKKKEKVRM